MDLITRHARARMQQRGIRFVELEDSETTGSAVIDHSVNCGLWKPLSPSLCLSSCRCSSA